MQKALFSFLLLVVSISQGTAQRLVSDAKITYQMQLASAPTADPSTEAGKFTQYVKGYLSRVDIDFRQMHYSYLVNTREQSVVTLMDLNGVKYLARGSKEDYERELKQYTALQFKDASETKQIAGYNCKKAVAKTPEGQTIEVYYSPDLVPENKEYNRRFVNIKGIPLQFDIINKAGNKVTMIATKVDLYAVPGSFFDIPKTGYKEISREELAQISN